MLEALLIHIVIKLLTLARGCNGEDGPRSKDVYPLRNNYIRPYRYIHVDGLVCL